MFFRLLKSKKGFTLVELMTVVTILGILTAVAVPVYFSNYKKKAREDCENQRIVVETLVKEAMTGMLDSGAAQYKTETRDHPSPLPGFKETYDYKYLCINFEKVPAAHKTTYSADNITGNADDAYNGKTCFKLTADEDEAFTLGDLRGGYRTDTSLEYNEGCKQGYYLKKKKLENMAFYKYLANAEIPVCPFTDAENKVFYNYYIFEDGTVLCSCPECH